MDPATTQALITGGSAIAGGLLGGDQENFGPGDRYPKWLFNDWREAGSRIADLQQPEYFPESTVAPLNPLMRGTINAMAGFGNTGGTGNRMMNQLWRGGQAGLGAMNTGLDYMGQLRDQGPNQFMYDQGTFDQTMANLTPGLEGVHAALMRDPIRQFREQTIPGINAAAAGAGQSFGTRPFNTGAIAARGLADRSADIGSQLWKNAANQAQRAAMTAGVQNLGSANTLQSDLLSNYGRYAGMAPGMYTSAYNMGTGNIGMRQDAANILQNYNQAQRDDDVARWNFEQNIPIDFLDRQLRMMGAQAMGGPPSGGGGSNWFRDAVAGAQAGNAIWNLWQNRPQSTPPIIPSPNIPDYRIDSPDQSGVLDTSVITDALYE